MNAKPLNQTNLKLTPSQIKYQEDKKKLQEKREKRAFESLSDKDMLRVQESLTTSAFVLTILNFETKKLKKMGLLENRTLIIESMVEYKKLEDYFKKNCQKNGEIKEFENSRNNFDDFIFRFVHATAEEMERTMKFLESIQNKRK